MREDSVCDDSVRIILCYDYSAQRIFIAREYSVRDNSVCEFSVSDLRIYLFLILILGPL